jgi:hypothetical protein
VGDGRCVPNCPVPHGCSALCTPAQATYDRALQDPELSWSDRYAVLLASAELAEASVRLQAADGAAPVGAFQRDSAEAELWYTRVAEHAPGDALAASRLRDLRASPPWPPRACAPAGAG